MSKSKFTLGPWKVWEGPEYMGGGMDLCIGAGETWLFNMDHRNSLCKKEQKDGWFAHLDSDTECDICSGGGDEKITEEQRATAHLIAAAPEMYEMLSKAFPLLCNHSAYRGLGGKIAALLDSIDSVQEPVDD